MKKILLAIAILLVAFFTFPASASASVPHGPLIFSDTFTGTSLDTSHWVTYVGAQGVRWGDRGVLPYPYSGFNQPGSTGSAIYDPAQLTVNNGLTIHAQRNTGNFSNLYSWRSDTINTLTKISLPDTGWFAVAKIKMPDTSHGMWPSMWFLPDQPGENIPELDGFEGGFHELASVPANRTAHYNYQGNPNNINQFSSEQDIGVDMSKAYHYYAVKYLPNQSVTFYFDGRQVFQVTNDQVPIVKGTYEMMVNMQVGSSVSASYHTTPTATSGDGGGMHVASVKVYQP